MTKFIDDSSLKKVIVFGVLLVLAFAALSARYASKQSLWVDESTQIVGLGLSYTDQISWLAGKLESEVNVPPDRAPPLSYFIGRAWGGVAGIDNETRLRWAGIVFVAAGIAVIFATMIVYGGYLPALVACAFLALSPNVLQTATELRAYPFLFFFSCLATAAYYFCLVKGAHWFGYACLIAAGLAAAYTHFFGVVLSAATIIGLFAVQLARKDANAWRTVIAGAVLATLLIGLAPFVLAAISISGGSAGPDGIGSLVRDTVRLAYRLFAHQSMKAISGFDILTLIAGLLIIVATLLRKGAYPNFVSVAPLVVGGVLVLVSGALITGFSALAPHYNIWMLPFLACCLGFGIVEIKDRLGSPLALLLLGALLAGSSVAQVGLWQRGVDYGHTRSADLRALVSDLGVERTTVLFDSSAGATFFPMHIWFGDVLDQYAMTPEGWQNTRTGEVVPVISPRKCVVLATTMTLSAAELTDAIWRNKLPAFKYDKRLQDFVDQKSVVFPKQLFLANEALELAAYC